MGDIERLLNKIVELKKGIDAIFVSELGRGLLLECSSTKQGRESQLIQKLMGADGSGGPAFAEIGVFGALQRGMDAFGKETGHGNLKFTVLQFGEMGNDETKGTVVVYTYHLEDMSLIIGFVNTRRDEDKFANLVFRCEQYVNDVWKLVEKEYKKSYKED